MKDILKKRVDLFSDREARYNALREGLQHLILKILDDAGYFQMLSFVGGTALRVIYDIRRFSEDVDFSLQKANDPRFQFEKLMKTLTGQLAIYGFPVDTKTKQRGAVQSLLFRFRDILQEWDIRPRLGQKLPIKWEVDTNPPLHARFESRILQKEFMFSVVHHDLPTLFAGKLLAFLNRGYTKGRDVYDLLWFMTNKTPINQRFFEEGMKQQSKGSFAWSESLVRSQLKAKVDALDMAQVQNDVRGFLDDPNELHLFKKDLLLKTLNDFSFLSDKESIL